MFLWASLFVSVVVAAPNGLGALPIMGWNTWCTLDGEGCGLDLCFEAEIRQMADAMVANGMYAAGYRYINLDDCWAGPRSANGSITADTNRFPSGSLKPIADYVHSKGLKFGLYTCAGTYTCVGQRPGSLGHYDQDAQTYASWDVDFVKMDWCNTQGLVPEIQYSQMWSSLNKTGRKIWFNTCEWGVHDPWTWARGIANSARIHGDHHDQWFGDSGTASIIETLAGKSKYAGPGYWNDPDFLMTDLGNQSPTEYATEFSLWALTASQLLVATDIRNMTALKKEILLNTEIIAVNQDPLGQAGDRVGLQNGMELWTKNLMDGSVAFVVYNPSNATQAQSVSVTGPDLGWNKHRTFTVRDLWAHKSFAAAKSFPVASIPAHGVFFGRASQVLSIK